MDFEMEHLSLIRQYESSASEIERMIFTKRYNLSQKHFSLLAVQSISILYSYWEGYVQKSFQMYIEYINSQNVNFTKLSDEIATFHIEHSFKQFKEYPQKTAKKVTFYNLLKAFFLKNTHKINGMVDTKSNVNFSILNRLLEQFSLDKFQEQWPPDYSYPHTNLKQLLDTFIRYRNGVAHGGDISSEEKITQEVYSKYRKLVVDLMYAIHDKFVDGIHNKTFIKAA